MTRLPLLGTAAAAIALSVVPASPAAAQHRGRVDIDPYIEVDQILDAALNNGSDVVTYTEVAAGVDASVAGPRASAQLSYRYERRFSYDHYTGDEDVHTGLARADVQVAKGVSLDAGGIATRTRSDIGGAAPGLLTGNVDNVSQVYSVYGGPAVSTSVGQVAVNAQYQAGYTKAETPNDGTGPVTGGRRRDYFDDSFGQQANVSASLAPNRGLPVGLSASAGIAREEAGQLKQHYTDKYVRGDVLVPVSAHVAVTGGVGYEKLTTSQKDPVLDAAGNPVLDDRGRYVTNDASPRRITYRTDGVYYDAGVVWRPNHRTSVEGHVGHRYGSTSYTGVATYQASKSVGAALRVYDSVETFGHQLREGLNNLPTSFTASRNPYLQQFNGCVFGANGTAGGCLNDVFQAIDTASFRARGVDGIITATRGLNSYGVGAGYANRKIFDPGTVQNVTLYGLEDESYYGQAFYARQLSRVSTLDVTGYLTYYDPALVGADGVWSYGATGSYTHQFGRLGTTAAVGVYASKIGDLDTDWSAQALLGARYTF